MSLPTFGIESAHILDMGWFSKLDASTLAFLFSCKPSVLEALCINRALQGHNSNLHVYT